MAGSAGSGRGAGAKAKAAAVGGAEAAPGPVGGAEAGGVPPIPGTDETGARIVAGEPIVELAKSRASAGPQVYVVQVRGAMREQEAGEMAFAPHPDGALWCDIATVTVPARSKRKTIIEAARAKVAIELPATLRVLDADAAREFPVGLKPRMPELVIG